MHQRDTSGLKNHAQTKRSRTLERAEAAIKRLIKEGKPVNFATVAEAAGVTRNWLYQQTEDEETGEPGLRERIEQLRKQGSPKKSVPPEQKASQASNAAKVKTLLQEVKKLRAENQNLRQQIEKTLGKVIYADEQAERCKRESEALRAENAELKKQLHQHRLQAANSSSNVVSFPGRTPTPTEDKTDKIQSELNQLGIKLNSTLNKVVQSASEKTVLTALEALKEANTAGAIKNPAGWLKRAIEDQWQPNDSYTQKNDLKLFNEWFALARAQRLAIASTQGDEEMMVLTADEQWLPFSEMLRRHSLESFK